MKHIAVEYNHDLKPIEALLLGVTHPGDFVIDGGMEIPMPRIQVEGVGTLSFPIPHSQIEAMVHQATQAPYGRGQETIVDTAIRNVWQISPNAVNIGAKSWETTFNNILSKVTTGLGCPDSTISAELYKLLIYETGGFFLAHRDTEKAPGMFGTLVLTLPSAHRGGALRIRHAGREATAASNAADPSELAFVAFYADCEHEVLPVLEGNRVCLVYNLIQRPGKTGAQRLQAPNYESQIEKAGAILEAFWKAPGKAQKLAWILEHQYSPASLSFSALKGADSAKSNVLLRAAARAGCAVHLAVVHIGESGAAEINDDDYYRSRRARYRYNLQPDGESESGGQNTSFDAITVDDGWQYLDEWSDRDDRPAEFGCIPLAGGELLPANALDGEPPDDRHLTEATGNEGASYERSYRRAAVVLWPSDRTIDVLLAGGVTTAIPSLKRLLAEGDSAWVQAFAAARRIVEMWPVGSSQHSYTFAAAPPVPADRLTMLAILTELNCSELLEAFIREVVVVDYDGSENGALIRAAGILSETQAAALFSALIGARMPKHPNACAELLRALPANPPPSFLAVADAAVEGLDGIETPKPENAWEPFGRGRPTGLGPEFIDNLISGLQHFEDGTRCAVAAGKIASRPDVFLPVTVVVPAIERLVAGQSYGMPAVHRAVGALWTTAAEFLLKRSELPPRPPADWRLDVQVSCHCEDCTELQAFASSPTEVVHRFRVRKERRSHLHQIIDRHGLDMTHVTERVGSPQTLVCTKDRRTFNARVQEYRSEVASMRALLQLTKHSASNAALSKRLEAAVQASAR